MTRKEKIDDTFAPLFDGLYQTLLNERRERERLEERVKKLEGWMRVIMKG